MLCGSCGGGFRARPPMSRSLALDLPCAKRTCQRQALNSDGHRFPDKPVACTGQLGQDGYFARYHPLSSPAAMHSGQQHGQGAYGLLVPYAILSPRESAPWTPQWSLAWPGIALHVPHSPHVSRPRAAKRPYLWTARVMATKLSGGISAVMPPAEPNTYPPPRAN